MEPIWIGVIVAIITILVLRQVLFRGNSARAPKPYGYRRIELHFPSHPRIPRLTPKILMDVELYSGQRARLAFEDFSIGYPFNFIMEIMGVQVVAEGMDGQLHFYDIQSVLPKPDGLMYGNKVEVIELRDVGLMQSFRAVVDSFSYFDKFYGETEQLLKSAK